MKETKYVARKGYRISNSDAAVIGPVLEKIPKKKRTASHVVEMAVRPASPLHKFFEWNDTTAAHQHRLHQARQLFQSYTIIYSDGRESRPVPRMISLKFATKYKEKGEQYYLTIDELSEDEALAEQYLDSLISEIVTLANQHEAVRRFVKIRRGETAKQLRGFFSIADQLSKAA